MRRIGEEVCYQAFRGSGATRDQKIDPPENFLIVVEIQNSVVMLVQMFPGVIQQWKPLRQRIPSIGWFRMA